MSFIRGVHTSTRAGDELVDERGVDKRLERLDGIKSHEPPLGRRRIGQSSRSIVCRQQLSRKGQRQFE